MNDNENTHRVFTLLASGAIGKVISVPSNTVDYMMHHLNSSELRLMLFIWRWTIGEGCDEVAMTQVEMAKISGLGLSSMTRTTQALVERGLIHVGKKQNKASAYSIILDAKIPDMEGMTRKVVEAWYG